MLEVLNPATEEVVEKLEPATGDDSDALDNSKTSVRVATPFGGMKQSGVGRELGLHALDYYTEIKNVYISTEED